jgi:Galactose-3-O-sulfotransferase
LGPRRNDLPVIFLHIGKTAGSTLRTILSRHYTRQETFRVYPTVYYDNLETLTSLPASRRGEIRLLMGHVPFGIHEHLPAPATYITMLREPVDRVMSLYYFARRVPEHYLHQPILRGNLDIERFVSDGLSWEMDNGQLRVLTGHVHDIEIGGCKRTLLDEAKRNVSQHFSVVGFSERFDESVLVTKRRLGWKGWPVYRKRNVTVGRRTTDRLSKSELAAIRKYNELDEELYDWVSAKFQREWEAEALDTQLTAFRLMNSMYHSYGSARRIASRLASASGLRRPKTQART